MSEIFEKAFGATEDHGLPLSVQADADIMRDGLDGAIAILDVVEGMKQSDNATLMATAPKMFNALKKCLEYLKRCPFTRNAELESEIETTLEEATK